jgi:agmatinase
MEFGELPKEFTDPQRSKVVILPVPYDGTSTWLKGADKGPEAILNASAAMWYYDTETQCEVHHVGIHTAQAVIEKSSPEAMVDAVETRVSEILASGKFPVVLGGEHSVSIGVFKALKKFHSGVTIVQFDAHADLMNEYEGSLNNHACAMSRAKELFPVVQVGIRTLDREEAAVIDNHRTFYAHDIHADPDWISRLLPLIGEKVYISFDLDAFDPSLLPGTGTPEPGGLQWYTVLEAIRKICEVSELTGFDVVELCPREGERTSDYIAARLVHKILSYRFAEEARNAYQDSQ